MTPELNLLGLTIFLGLLHIVVTAGAITAQRGIKWNLGARDNNSAPPGGKVGRLDRALQNFKETFPFFLAAVLMVQVTQHNNSYSALGARLYFWARVIYIPLYVLGIPVARTAVWSISILGILFILCALA